MSNRTSRTLDNLLNRRPVDPDGRLAGPQVPHYPLDVRPAPPMDDSPLASNAQDLGGIDLNLDVAETVGRELPLSGNVLAINHATDDDTTIQLKLSDNGLYRTYRRGAIIQGIPFARVWAKWSAQAGKSIELTTAIDRTPESLVLA